MSLDSVGIALTPSFHRGAPVPADLLAAARLAEERGFDAIWSGDHVLMHNPMLDSIVVLASYAAVTERIRIGTSVYLMPLRHPVITAKQIASLDVLSGGRFVFGVGVGGEVAREFAAVEVPVRERGSRTDEALEIVTRLLAGERLDFEGRHFQLRDVLLEPLPTQRPRPPIWVGGRSEAALRRTLRFGDGWLGYLVSPRRMAEALEQLRERAGEHGRKPAELATGLFVFVALDEDRESARRRAVSDLTELYRQPFESAVDRYCAFGTPEQAAEHLQQYVDAGISNLVISPLCSPDRMAEQIELLAGELLPALDRG